MAVTIHCSDKRCEVTGCGGFATLEVTSGQMEPSKEAATDMDQGRKRRQHLDGCPHKLPRSPQGK